jgi:hypothetical protein
MTMSSSGWNSEIGQDGFGGQVSSRFPSQVETLPQVRLNLAHAPGAGVVETPEMEMREDAAGMQESPAQEMMEHHSDIHHGFTCQHCKATAKTAHGFARHLRTHGFGVIGRHFQK